MPKPIRSRAIITASKQVTRLTGTQKNTIEIKDFICRHDDRVIRRMSRLRKKDLVQERN